MTDETTQSPFTRPRFIVAAVVVALLVIVGVVLVVVNSTDKDNATPGPSSQPSVSTSAAATEKPSTSGGASVCGLNDVQMDGTVTSPPAAEWAYAGTTGFPTSDVYGPGKKLDTGIETCFSRTPEGAIFAASSGLGYLLNAPTVRPWQEYALAQGSIRDEILAAQPGQDTSSDRAAERSTVSGFRLLSYDGNTARVDVATQTVVKGKTIYMSVVMPLVWEAGDWRVQYTEADRMAQPGQLPNLAGYAVWER